MSDPVFEYSITAKYGNTTVLNRVTGSLTPGANVSLVGLSGSGKTTLSLALLRLLHYRDGVVEGSIKLQGRELMTLTQKEMRSVRGKQIGYVPQSPASALNPRLSVDTLLEETWRAHANGKPTASFYGELLSSVSLPTDATFRKKLARDLSVGQGQRLLIALAILHRPAVLLADEPTSALDVITQSHILALLSELSSRLGMATLFISHDLQAVASFSSEVHILHHGSIVESGPPLKIFKDPEHEFTKELVQAIPKTF